MEYVARLHLKTECGDNLGDLVAFCLNHEKQYLAIGWSYVYEDKYLYNIKTFSDYYHAVREEEHRKNKRLNSALNVFGEADENALFWTRDHQGFYWICRVTEKAKPYYDPEKDIGALLPIQAYKVGLEVPGQIKATFNRKNGGTVERIYDDIIIEYSKYIYNEESRKQNISSGFSYSYKPIRGSILDNLPAFDLEELVISYLQLKQNYYVLSNSIANKSTTIKVECELISRDLSNPKKAVVQVKGGRTTEIDAADYKVYSDAGYTVYLYAPKIVNLDGMENIIGITRKELLAFYQEYKAALPDSVTKWDNLFI